jgi:hypothetical protein
MQGSCHCQAWQATTRHLAVKKNTPTPEFIAMSSADLKSAYFFYQINSSFPAIKA